MTTLHENYYFFFAGVKKKPDLLSFSEHLFLPSLNQNWIRLNPLTARI